MGGRRSEKEGRKEGFNTEDTEEVGRARRRGCGVGGGVPGLRLLVIILCGLVQAEMLGACGRAGALPAAGGLAGLGGW